MAIHVDNHKNRGPRYCPLMKEMCIKGWTKSMGQDETTGARPTCAAWQPVELSDITKKTTESVFDCSVFGWGPDLLTEIAQEVHQDATGTDKVANQIKRLRVENIASLPEDYRLRLITSAPQLTEQIDGLP